MKKGNVVRLLTEKDMEGSEHKLPYMSEFDKLVEVGRVASQLYDQENQNNVKSWGKRHVISADQESKRTALFSSTTCRISREELFKGGRKMSKGGTSSSSSRYVECGNVRRSWGYDHVEKEMVLGNKRKCYVSKDEDFEYGDHVVKEKVLGRKRKCYDFKDEDFDYSEKEEKKARNNGRARNKVVETAPLPVNFANAIQALGGNDVRLLIQKEITNSDVNTKENRFLIPRNQVRDEAKGFLTEAENKVLDTRIPGEGIVSMQVPLLEPDLRRSHIKFKKWNMNTSNPYILCGSWSAMQQRNHLEAYTDIQVWSFRVDGELNLALVKVPGDRLQI